MTDKLVKGGVQSNLDIKRVSDAEREYGEKIEQMADAIEKSGKQKSDYDYAGEFNPRNHILTTGHQKNNAKAVKDRIANNEPIKPVGHIASPDGSVHRWLLDDVDAEVVQEGYACQECLGWQSVPGLPYCDWKYGDGGCGYRQRDI